MSVIIYLLMKVKYTILEKFLAHYDAKLKNKKGQSLKSPLMLRKEALKPEAVTGVMQPQAKERLGPPGAGRGKKGFTREPSERARTRRHPGFGVRPPELERTSVCPSQPLRVCSSEQRPRETHTPGGRTHPERTPWTLAHVPLLRVPVGEEPAASRPGR